MYYLSVNIIPSLEYKKYFLMFYSVFSFHFGNYVAVSNVKTYSFSASVISKLFNKYFMSRFKCDNWICANEFVEEIDLKYKFVALKFDVIYDKFKY